MSTAPVPNIALASFSQVGSFTNDPLLADGHDVTSMIGTIASGGGFNYRGAIKHIDRATGAITTAVTGAAATAANCVVAENCDATSANAACLVYLTGRMKADAVIWPPAGTHAAHTEDLRNFGIYLESVLFRDGVTVKSAPTQEEEADAKKRLDRARERLKAKADQDKEEIKEGAADSQWSHMTAEEREKQPDLDTPPTEQELEEEKEKKQPREKPASPPPAPSKEQPPPRR